MSRLTERPHRGGGARPQDTHACVSSSPKGPSGRRSHHSQEFQGGELIAGAMTVGTLEAGSPSLVGGHRLTDDLPGAGLGCRVGRVQNLQDPDGVLQGRRW